MRRRPVDGGEHERSRDRAPWCGTPEPDAAAALPDGSDPSHLPGSFPHIPYYAIGCTLDSIAAQSNGRMKVEVIGQSALGRKLYPVTINELTTSSRRRDFTNWQALRELSRSKPQQAQKLLDDFGGNVKVPLEIQAGIHGCSGTKPGSTPTRPR